METDKQTTETATETLNKNGDKRGCKDTNKQNFANDKQAASKAGKKSTSKSIVQAITKSDAIANGRHKQITPELRQFIRDELLAQGKNGTTYLQKFVKAFLNEAVIDMNSNPARLLSNAIFKDDFISQLDIDAIKAMNEDIDYKKYLVRTTLYDKQKEVYDNDHDKGIIIINSRRSGKTELLGRLATKGLLKPDGHVVYINRNSTAAIRQIRGPLETALEKVGLKCIKGSVDAQEMHFENGSQLIIIGNNNAADIDKLRGERISMCLLDECAHQRNMKQLVREVISPAMKDYADSQLIMVGTPPRIPHTYIEEMWNNNDSSFKKYHWTFQDNPFIPNRETVIEEVCKEFGIKEDNPIIQREYYGIMGAYDTEAMIFKGYKTIPLNTVNMKDTFDFAYVGVDWGFEDKAAVVSAVVKGKQMYIIDSWSEAKQDISTICKEVKRQKDYLDTLRLAHRSIVIADTNEKAAIMELYNTYKIKDAYCAYKYNKDMALDQMAEWFRTDTMFVTDKAKHLKEDFDNMLWKRDEETDAILHEVDDDLYHGNAAFATLYITRQFDFDVLGRTNAKTAKSVLEG